MVKRTHSNRLLSYFFVVISFIGCSLTNKTSDYTQAVPYTESEQPNIDFLTEIKPILDARCVVCHSCYNSPCQLKLSSYEGFDRGATKVSMYQARMSSIDPTRLFIDATSTEEWRDKGFFSVLDTNASDSGSIAMMMLRQKRLQPDSEGTYISERKLTCSETEKEVTKFFKENPHKGMPYGFPELEDEEYALLMAWLKQGAQKDSTTNTALNIQVEKWEAFLNGTAIKNQVMSRYIYEHLYIGHIYFPSDSSQFYDLVRSKTPPGEPIDVIATRYPFDAPESETMYYRLRQVHSTIVDKTHMTYELSDSKMKRYESLFLKPKWEEKPYLPSYDIEISANPFLAYKQIPAKSRYEFLLDNVYFMMSTFIKGPVCNGQTALDVIQDQTWMLFLKPEYDLSVLNKNFLDTSFKNLTLPNQAGSDAKVSVGLFGEKFGKEAVEYYRYRDDQYSEAYKDGMNLNFLWKDPHNNSSVLTVYRHFDSGSVHKGALGNLPKTLWVIDYPLLERIYYSLVAGFDVFAGETQKLMIRTYMNRMRIEGESNFLDFLPEEARKETFDSWYIGKKSEKKSHYYSTSIESGVDFETENYKEEFALKALKKLGVSKDPINYSKEVELTKEVLNHTETKEEIELGLSYLAQHVIPSYAIAFDFKYVNLAHMRIRMNNGEYLLYSMVINRWHDNVSFIFNEESRTNVQNDRFNFVEGFIGSYPNAYFDIQQDDVSDLFGLLATFEKSYEKDFSQIGKYTVNRAEPEFWSVFDWFQNKYYESDKLNAGLFDLNRYYPIAK